MRRAFTLIEMLIVIAIIAILCAIVIPNLSNSKKSFKVIYPNGTEKIYVGKLIGEDDNAYIITTERGEIRITKHGTTVEIKKLNAK